MFDMSWGEVLIIGAVALIVIGPKDLPRTLRTVGNMVGKVKRMAGEFQTQFSDAMREAELDEIRREVEAANRAASSVTTDFNPVQTVRDEVKGAIESRPEAGVPAATAAAVVPPAVVPTPDLPPIPDPVAALAPPSSSDAPESSGLPASETHVAASSVSAAPEVKP